MLDKRESRMYQGVRRDQIYTQVCDFWARSGFYVAQISPYHVRGESYHQKIGLKREFYLRLDEHEGNTYMDLQFSAKITDEGMVGGAAAAIIFLPVALVGGALSYTEYEDDARKLMGSFWAYADQITNVRGVMAQLPTPPPPQVYPQTQKTVPCSGCGALVMADWKACPYCGGNLK